MEQTLKERIKEINCLYDVSKIVEQGELSLEVIFQKVIDLIPSSWQYPEFTCAQLLINDQSYRTANYKNTFWHQRADVVAQGQPLGVLTVCYLEKRPERDEGPFLTEERSLLNAIAERIGRTWEHRQTERALGLSEQKLKDQNLMLKDKNIALREIMNQVTTEKETIEKNILANVDKFLLPLVKKLKNRGSAIDRQYLDLLEESIRQLTSGFGIQISKKSPGLTPRENEICNMVRSGLSSKEIAKLLNISYRSVETYRNYIRKKLGITNKKINLATYLASL
ncbi:MAG: LuxR C-terminal-related transcriptional regulator [Desulfobacterium sp.]|nr:LuxR C-terminal-related transcriptional regulator [Desulfobacterium sp.]